MSDQKMNHGGNALGFGLILLGLLGAGWLYQREGGKVFELPQKLAEPPPPLLLLESG